MLPVLLLVGSLVSVEGTSEGSCWGYDVLCTTADYQFRSYNESVWVGVRTSRGIIDKGAMPLLRQYLRWTNFERMKIQNSEHVLLSMSGREVLAVYMMLPEELWDNPPAANYSRRDNICRRTARMILSLSRAPGMLSYVTTAPSRIPINDQWTVLYLKPGAEIWFVATGGFDCPAP